MICPICELRRILVEHHIWGREIPNFNAIWNRVYICGACHDAVHTDNENGIIIEGWVSTSNGQELAWHKRGEANKYLESATPKLYGSKDAI